MVNEEIKETSDFPWLVFKLCNNYYAVNSRSIVSIMIIPENITPVADSPNYIRGIVNVRGKILPLVDLRLVMGIQNIEEENKQFIQMISDRKQDHINWVNELARCIDVKTHFHLAIDPTKCAFGIWYDKQKSDNTIIDFQLRKINEPHIKLHKLAEDVNALIDKSMVGDSEAIEKLNDIIRSAKFTILPEIVSILDEIISIYTTGIKEMAILLESDDEEQMGIIVDEVLQVENITPIADKASNVYANPYVCAVGNVSKSPDLIMMLDEEKIIKIGKFDFNAYDEYGEIAGE